MDGRTHRALAPIASHGSAELLSDNNYFMEAEEGDEVRNGLYNNNNLKIQNIVKFLCNDTKIN